MRDFDGRTARIEDLLAHAEWLRKLAGRLVRHTDAEDMAQEAWVAAMRSPPQGAAEDGQPWLAQVLRNLVRKRWRATGVRTRAAAVQGEPASPPNPEDLLAHAQIQQQVATLVLELEEPYRTAVLLRYYEGRTAADIAEILHLPAGTVRWRLSEAVARLRTGLDGRHGGDRERWRRALIPLAGVERPGGGASALGKGAAVMAMNSKIVLLAGATALLVLLAGGAWVWYGAQGAVPPPGTDSPASARRRMLGLAEPDQAKLPAAVVQGSVLDPSGAAVQGAMVALSRASSRLQASPNRMAAVIATDSKGRFIFEAVPAGQYLVSVTEPHWLPSSSLVFDLAPGGRKDLTLSLAAGGEVLEGRVLDEDGNPISGARVVADRGQMTYTFDVPSPVYQAVSDEIGRYTLRLSPREYTLTISAGGYATEETTVALSRAMYPGGAAAGTVTDEAGKGIAGARLSLTSPTTFQGLRLTGVSGTEGAFLLEGVIPGQYSHPRSAPSRARRSRTPAAQRSIIGFTSKYRTADSA